MSGCGVSFPFRAWWTPDKWARALWGLEGVVLPRRIPVWAVFRAPAECKGIRNWILVGPKLVVFGTVSSTVSVPTGGSGPRSRSQWSAAWSARCRHTPAEVQAFVQAEADAYAARLAQVRANMHQS